jgi:chromosome segregation ATPase
MPEDLTTIADARPGHHDLDPTPRTVQQIYREIASLKELVFTRLDALERKQEDFEADVTRVPTEVMKAVTALDAVVEERLRIRDERFCKVESLSQTRLAGIEAAMAARKEAVEAHFKAGENAVAAALAAQKERVDDQNRAAATAIAKSETATSRQLEAQSAQSHASAVALDQRIADMKDRLTRLESGAAGATSERAELRAARTDTHGSQGIMIALAGFALSVALVVAGWLSSIGHISTAVKP